jgi:uncharacterized RDD family membrane protein YckC
VVTDYPGERYGLPAEGPGSVAALGRRLLALIADCVLASLVTSLFVTPGFLQPQHAQTANYWSLLVWFVITVAGTWLFAATPGMVLTGIRVARVGTATMLPPWRAALRALLVALVIPAVVWDVDRRGLHDKVAGTMVLTIR